jgi:mono/diheme cytochrome c family protein
MRGSKDDVVKPRSYRFTWNAAAALIALGVLSGCHTSMYEYSVTPQEYSGVRLYQVYCSSCHGLTGRGDGPVEPLLRTGVPDLTKLADRNGGQFPKERVRAAIDGRENFIAHGPRDMPVWGFEFNDGAPNAVAARHRADAMIDRITQYLASLQAD